MARSTSSSDHSDHNKNSKNGPTDMIDDKTTDFLGASGRGMSTTATTRASKNSRPSVLVIILSAWMVFSVAYMMITASNATTLTFLEAYTREATEVVEMLTWNAKGALDASLTTSDTASGTLQALPSSSSLPSSLWANHRQDQNAMLVAATRHIPLPDLVDTDKIIVCPHPLVRYNDTILDPRLAYSNNIPDNNDDNNNGNSEPQWQIPRIIHFTSKSRCVLPQFINFLDKWKFANYSVFFHDDDAVDRLLYEKFWPEFPDVHHVLACTLSGAAKADLWRAVVLYEYGGVYTDIDNLPNKFDGNKHIAPDDESFFVVEKLGVLSQYFMASQPKHPLMYLLVKRTINAVLRLTNANKQYAPVVTGPGALKNAMIEFMNFQDKQENKKLDAHERYQRVMAGKYVGFMNATVTVVGVKEKADEWVLRDKVGRKFGVSKDKAYAAMNMTHFSKTRKTQKDESCVHRIYRQVVLPQYRQRQKEHDKMMMMMMLPQQQQHQNGGNDTSWLRPLW